MKFRLATALWDAGAVVGTYGLFYVVIKAPTWVGGDPLWLKISRVGAFFIASVMLGYSISCWDWTPDIPDVMVLYGGVIIIILNAVSLHIREKQGG